jgi:exosortase
MSTGRRVWLILVALVLAICYAPVLAGMITQWMLDEDMAHGFLVPLVAAWIVWRGRKSWAIQPVRPSAWGYAIIAVGAGLHAVSALGAGLFAGSLGFLISLIGVIVCLWGFPRLRAWSFPLVLLLFMLPKLAVVYNQLTLPLQLLASRMAAGMLSLSGAAVIREGNVLEFQGHRILVAEACSGIRYLLPMAFLAIVFAYLADPKWWMRLVLVAVAVPVAIVANALRVAIAGASPTFAEGSLHTLTGWLLFIVSLAALAGARRMFNRFWERAHA